MKELLSFHLSQWNCGHEGSECIFEPRYIRASKTLKPQTASISTTSWKPHAKHSKHAENWMDTEKKDQHDTRTKGKTYEKICVKHHVVLWLPAWNMPFGLPSQKRF